MISRDGGNRTSFLSDFTESTVISLTGSSVDYTINIKTQCLKCWDKKKLSDLRNVDIAFLKEKVPTYCMKFYFIVH
jgi:hypothetical protein